MSLRAKQHGLQVVVHTFDESSCLDVKDALLQLEVRKEVMGYIIRKKIKGI